MLQEVKGVYLIINNKYDKKIVVEFRKKRFHSPFKSDSPTFSDDDMQKSQEALARFKAKEEVQSTNVSMSDDELKKRAQFFGNKNLLSEIRTKEYLKRQEVIKRREQFQSNQPAIKTENKTEYRGPFVSRPNQQYQVRTDQKQYIRPPYYQRTPAQSGQVDPSVNHFNKFNPNAPQKPFYSTTQKPGESTFTPRSQWKTGSSSGGSSTERFNSGNRPFQKVYSKPGAVGSSSNGEKKFIPKKPFPIKSFFSPVIEKDAKKNPLKKQKILPYKSAIQRSSKPRAFNSVSHYTLANRLIGTVESFDMPLDIDKQRSMSSIKRSRQKISQSDNKIVPKNIVVFSGMTIQILAKLMSITVSSIIQKMKELNYNIDKNYQLDLDTASFIVAEYGHNPKKKTDILDKINLKLKLESNEIYRAPVVTVVGHVDHGKTSLLDAIRKTQVAAKEAGGITQGIGASQVFLPDGKFITFLDTPGHKVFTEMRARGVNLTDIVLLIIAADDGIQEQTIESIKRIKASNAFLIVVFTKVDKPNINLDKIKNMLYHYEISVESLGGNVPDVQVSAKTGHNLEFLLEVIAAHSEILDLKASEKDHGKAIVIESYLDKHKGNIANIIVKNGIINKGDSFLCGLSHGKVRAMTDWKGQIIDKAGPSMPVQLSGFADIVNPGDELIVMSESDSKEASHKRSAINTIAKVANIEQKTYTYMDIWKKLANIKEGSKLYFIIKADSSGSAEAIEASLSQLIIGDVSIDVIEKGVGAVSETNLISAKTGSSANNANIDIIAFKVDVPTNIAKMAQNYNVNVLKYSVIYQIFDDISAKIHNQLRPKQKLVELGRAEIRAVFTKPKIGTIAGCMVTDGTIMRGLIGALIRNGVEIYKSSILSIRHMKDDKKEVKNGQECGIMIENFADFKIGDIIICSEMRDI